MSTTTSPDTDLDSIDLSVADRFASGPPHELFARFRAESPVHRNRSAAEGDFWSVFRRDDIQSVLRDATTFSSARPTAFMHDEKAIIPVEVLQAMMLNMDAPSHTRYRKIVSGSFTPKAMERYEALVAEHCAKLVDEVVDRGGCDFVASLAVPLPLVVIAAVLGIEDADIDQLFHWTNVLVGAQDPTLRADDGALMTTLGEVAMFVAGLVQDRRATPREDLLSRIVHAEIDGERLADEELVSFFILLMTAGNETTRNTLAIGWRGLMDRPDQVRLLGERPELIGPAVDELLRFASPIMHFRRTATRDTEIGGQAIAAGDKVIMWYSSGNRDEAVFERPDELDVTRTTKRTDHVALGGGAHKCLGQHLARIELRHMIGELVRRTPDMEVAGEVGYVRSNLFHGYTTLPVRFTPGARAVA